MKRILILRIIIIILILIWMNFVFNLSAQNSTESSNLSLKIASWLFNNYETQLKMERYIRKIAHFSEYALGGVLFFSFFSTFKLSENTNIVLASIMGILYAFTDEFHQLFVDGRSGQLKDVYIDSLGVVTGVCFMCLIIKIFINNMQGGKNDKF